MYFLLFATIACFFLAFRFLRRKRVITDTPTSRIRSAAQGYVELAGQGKYIEGESITSPLTGTPCLWYQVKVERDSLTIAPYGGHQWDIIMEESSDQMFLLQGETGECLIAPVGAEVTVNDEVVWYGDTEKPSHRPPNARKKGSTRNFLFGNGFGTYRYTERLIHENEKIYAIGLFETTGGDNAATTTTPETIKLIREWEKNSTALLEKFDKNKDGEIDIQEWREIREAAYKEIMARKDQSAQAPVNIMGKTNDRQRPFLLSAVNQDALVRKFHYYTIGCFIGFALCGTASVMLIAMRYSG